LNIEAFIHLVIILNDERCLIELIK
jgi:hypothetical protein